MTSYGTEHRGPHASRTICNEFSFKDLFLLEDRKTPDMVVIFLVVKHF